jgi:predicted transposase/invertase (TIGR01784 family)
MRYLDPKNDLTFKKIFGEHPHLLISFLNNVLPLEEGRKILSIEYLPAELTPSIPLFKHSIVDVRCKDNEDRQFIVEMQMLWTNSFMNRVLFNASKAFVKQLEKGEQYELLQPVYAVSLVNQNFDLETESYFHHYKIVNVEMPDKLMTGLEFVFIELPKVKARNLKDRALGVLWLRFMAEIKDLDESISAEFLEYKELKEASEILMESAFNSAELESYDRYWDSISVEKTIWHDARKEGLTEGREEGKIEGKIEGKEEERDEIVGRAYREGVSIPLISKITGISENEVEDILRKLGLI